MASIGARIRSRRIDKSLTQTALAAAVGRCQSTVVDWEIRGIEPRASDLIRLAAALDVTTDWLLGVEAAA